MESIKKGIAKLLGGKGRGTHNQPNQIAYHNVRLFFLSFCIFFPLGCIQGLRKHGTKSMRIAIRGIRRVERGERFL